MILIRSLNLLMCSSSSFFSVNAAISLVFYCLNRGSKSRSRQLRIGRIIMTLAMADIELISDSK